jgi:hypothetical protein
MMDHTQLELDLKAVEAETELDVSAQMSAHVVSLQCVRERRQQQQMKKVYNSILESVEHIVTTTRLFK